jgi:hypothetical protein
METKNFKVFQCQNLVAVSVHHVIVENVGLEGDVGYVEDVIVLVCGETK